MPSYEWIKNMEELEKLKIKVKILEDNIYTLQGQLQEAYKRIKILSSKGTIGYE
tara:strand:+ start:34 stop:195 length:162 start_codon:yes stop_codon:yes gene_type:complete